MKKLLFLVLAFLSLSVFMARSQDVDHHKHTVSVSFGAPAGWIWYMNSMYYDNYGSDLKSLYSPTTEYTNSSALMIGYSYQTGEFRLGADLAYGYVIATETPGPAFVNKTTKELTQNLFSFVPFAEWTYDSGRRYAAYFKAGLGAELAIGDLATKVRPAWELVPLGFRFGRRLYFMMELGFGSEYAGRIGIGYHF